MRTALLAALNRNSAGQLRADLPFFGRSVLGRQVDLVLSLGCERVLCLCEAPTKEMLTLQREVESAGGTFHSVRSNIQLAGLVHADDELVMLRDGLIPDENLLIELVGASPEERGAHRLSRAIMTLPIDHPFTAANPEEYERIDRERNWAGLAVMRASQLQKLAHLPPDGDAMSLLLRLALQARVECVELDLGASDQNEWLLAQEEAALEELERTLIEDQRNHLSDAGLGSALAAQIPISLAPRWLASGSEGAAGAALLAVGTLLVITLWVLSGSGEMDSLSSAGALALAGFSAFAGEMSIAWGRLRQALWPKARKAIAPNIVRSAVDAACLYALLIAHGWQPNLVVQIALPLLAIGLARIAGADEDGKLSGFWRDRALHMAGFALAAAGGVLSEALALFTLGALVQLMLRGRGN